MKFTLVFNDGVLDCRRFGLVCRIVSSCSCSSLTSSSFRIVSFWFVDRLRRILAEFSTIFAEELTRLIDDDDETASSSVDDIVST